MNGSALHMLRKTGLGAALLGLTLLVAGTARAADEDVKMGAIGGLSAAFLVQSYLNIGLLADASAKKDADKEQLASTLTIVENLLGETEKQLDTVLKSDITDDDKAALKKIKSCYALLNEQISALHTFWKEQNEANGKAFEQTRVEAWKKISATLGIK